MTNQTTAGFLFLQIFKVDIVCICINEQCIILCNVLFLKMMFQNLLSSLKHYVFEGKHKSSSLDAFNFCTELMNVSKMFIY